MITDLGQVWLNTAADPSVFMAFESTGIEHNPAVTVRVDAYAAGNYRAVRTAGRQKTAKVTLTSCTDDQVAWIKDQQGALLCYRDPRGEKFFGIYTDPACSPLPLPNWWTVTLTVLEVTWSEEAVPS